MKHASLHCHALGQISGLSTSFHEAPPRGARSCGDHRQQRLKGFGSGGHFQHVLGKAGAGVPFFHDGNDPPAARSTSSMLARTFSYWAPGATKTTGIPSSMRAMGPCSSRPPACPRCGCRSSTSVPSWPPANGDRVPRTTSSPGRPQPKQSANAIFLGEHRADPSGICSNSTRLLATPGARCRRRPIHAGSA